MKLLIIAEGLVFSLILMSIFVFAILITPIYTLKKEENFTYELDK